MPNWCHNVLRLGCENGEIQELRRFLDENSGGESGVLSLNRSHPVPSTLSDSEAHDWRVKNWNTKWDVQDGYVDEWDDMLVIHFETAWAPPLGWLEVVVALYPLLNFYLEYREPNTCLFGEVMGEGGEIISHLLYEPVELVR
jgi:hypothetical protein